MFSKSTRVEMLEGPIIPRVLLFTIPIILTSLLQLAYNAADLIVLGQFENENALAAVGATGSLNGLMIQFLVGLSVGVNVVAARYYGARKTEELSKTVHTSIMVSVIGGVILMALCLIFSRILLELMDTPSDIIDMSETYIKLLCLGMPATMLFNFGSSVLRAIGETKKPLLFLGISGLINVGLNLIFVFFFRMSVSGVAIATIAAQYISAVMVIVYLMKIDVEGCKFSFKKLHIWKQQFISIIKYGLPSGIQSSLFSLSNVIIQAQINSFSTVAVAGNTAAGNISNFLYAVMNAFSIASTTFTSQNIGARKVYRLKRILYSCILLVSVIGIAFGGLVLLFDDQLLQIYIPDDPLAVAAGEERLLIFCLTYFLNGILDVIVGVIRGMGKPVSSTLISVVGICVVRILWIYTVFALNHTLLVLYLAYPASWLTTAVIQYILYLSIRKKIYKKYSPIESQPEKV